MKKLFVILMAIFIFLIPGCKPALPGATISIVNETGVKPESYELEILFDDNRSTNPRAFHMKNIGSDIVSNSKSISLENMPRAMYTAEVKAYLDGKQVGIGKESFDSKLADAVVEVTVKEMPYAYYAKSFRFTKGTVDSIILTVTNDSGERIDRAEFLGLTERDSFTSDKRKIRVDNINANFTWILLKGSSTVETYTDRIENIIEGNEYKLTSTDLSLELTAEDWTYQSHEFGSITLNVDPIPELRDKIGKFRFELTDINSGRTETFDRILSDDNLYVFDNRGKNDYSVKVTPLMKDGETPLNSLSATTGASTNKPLEKVEIEMENGKTDLLLTEDTYKLKITKTPANYTSWSEGKVIDRNGVIEITENGTFSPVAPGFTDLAYIEEFQTEMEITPARIDISLRKPILEISGSGTSNIVLRWKDVHKNSTLVISQWLNGNKQEDILIDPVGNAASYDGITLSRNTTAEFQITARQGSFSESSEKLSYTTGENNFLEIILPEINDMDIMFTPSLNYDKILDWNDKVTFTVNTIQNSNIAKVIWIVNNKQVQETSFSEEKDRDTFVFSTEDLNIDLQYGIGIVSQEVVIAVEDLEGKTYSKNIKLNLNMESRHE